MHPHSWFDRACEIFNEYWIFLIEKFNIVRYQYMLTLSMIKFWFACEDHLSNRGYITEFSTRGCNNLQLESQRLISFLSTRFPRNLPQCTKLRWYHCIHILTVIILNSNCNFIFTNVYRLFHGFICSDEYQEFTLLFLSCFQFHSRGICGCINWALNLQRLEIWNCHYLSRTILNENHKLFFQQWDPRLVDKKVVWQSRECHANQITPSEEENYIYQSYTSALIFIWTPVACENVIVAYRMSSIHFGLRIHCDNLIESWGKARWKSLCLLAMKEMKTTSDRWKFKRKIEEMQHEITKRP